MTDEYDEISKIPWADAAQADPISDLRAYSRLVYEQSGYQPTTIYASKTVKDAYETAMVLHQALNHTLSSLSRRHFIHRYVLKRMLGQSRLKIVFPLLYRLRYRARMRWLDFKHRNDPYWDY